jgi:hypothetical protein
VKKQTANRPLIMLASVLRPWLPTDAASHLFSGSNAMGRIYC